MNPRGDVNDPQGELNYSLFHYFSKTRKTTIYSPLPGECETSSYIILNSQIVKTLRMLQTSWLINIFLVSLIEVMSLPASVFLIGSMKAGHYFCINYHIRRQPMFHQRE